MHRAAARIDADQRGAHWLKTDINQELKWNNSINSTNVGMGVKDEIVTLAGPRHLRREVRHRARRAAREDAA
jgi:osmotically-inducible protein OsmY